MGFSKWRFSSTNRDSPGPVGQGLVLQGALAALVAHRAVERVVDQQELEDAVLGLLDLVGVGDHLRARLHLDEAAGLQGGAPGAADLDQAHPAHPDRLHAGVVAEPGDEGAGPLGGGDEHLALAPGDLPAVEGEGHLSRRGRPRRLDARSVATSPCRAPVGGGAGSLIGAAPLLDVDEELVAEHLDGRADRRRDGRAEHADGGLLGGPGQAGGDVVAGVEQQVEVLLPAVARSRCAP